MDSTGYRHIFTLQFTSRRDAETVSRGLYNRSQQKYVVYYVNVQSTSLLNHRSFRKYKNLGADLRIQCEQNKSNWSSWLTYWYFYFNTTSRQNMLPVNQFSVDNVYYLVVYRVALYPLYNYNDSSKRRQEIIYFIINKIENQCMTRITIVLRYKGDLIFITKHIDDKLDNVYDSR